VARGGTPAIVALTAAGVRFEVHEFENAPSERGYGLAAAAALGVEPERVFKTLLATIDDTDHAVGIVPVSGQLSLKELAAALGAKRAEMCVPQTAERLTGYVVGGISPFGQKRLMPTAMHPFMNPATETVLWDDKTDIYRTYDRIYDCRGHGWANLQSMHVNLPFANDSQFARLHAAVRLVLPLLPALAASSPIADGVVTPMLDFRLDAYYAICASTPSVAGDVVPETVGSRAEYDARVLAPMYDEIAPLDPAGVLRHEWLNSRGAIARFDRNAIEIRVIDVQECPLADLSIAAAVINVIRWLYDERSASLADQQALETSRLARILRATIRDADEAIIDDVPYLRALGVGAARCSAADVWRALLDASAHDESLTGAPWRPALDVILAEGPLARRILRATGAHPTRQKLHDVYASLCECLQHDKLFA